jgi:hypothetical protein
MNKIKTVKIKEEDGSISEKSYTIAADAINIDMSNGENLQDTVGNIDIDEDGNIAGQLKNANRNLNELNIDIEKKPYYYTTVQNMREDTNLKVGMLCETMGYHSINDGGSAKYEIVTGPYLDDGGSYHLLRNGLFAKLIIENGEINVNQFGAYGDNTHDDTEAIQTAIDYANSFVIAGRQGYDLTVVLLAKRYLISNINLRLHTHLVGKGQLNTELIFKDGTSGNGITLSVNDFAYCYVADLSMACRNGNNTIENAIYINTSMNHDCFSTFENIRINYIPHGNGVNNDKGGRENRFNNIDVCYCGGYGIIGGASDSLYYNCTCR